MYFYDMKPFEMNFTLFWKTKELFIPPVMLITGSPSPYQFALLVVKNHGSCFYTLIIQDKVHKSLFIKLAFFFYFVIWGLWNPRNIKMLTFHKHARKAHKGHLYLYVKEFNLISEWKIFFETSLNFRGGWPDIGISIILNAPFM